MATSFATHARAEVGDGNIIAEAVDVQYRLAIAVSTAAPDGEGADAIRAHVAEGHGVVRKIIVLQWPQTTFNVEIQLRWNSLFCSEGRTPLLYGRAA